MNTVVQGQLAPTKHEARLYQTIQRLLQPLPTVALHDTQALNRHIVEGYVAKKFADAYGATITEFMPKLLSLSCQDKFSAVAGVRSAQKHPLFLERYLDHPIEHLLSECCEGLVKRESVIEIGNLVATHRGSSQLLFILLTAILHQADFGWVVFTAVPQVQKILNRLGIRTYFLAQAEPTRLTLEEQQQWGKYYQSKPRVIAGNLAGGMDSLRQHPLWQSALSLYQSQVEGLSSQLNRQCDANERSIIAA